MKTFQTMIIIATVMHLISCSGDNQHDTGNDQAVAFTGENGDTPIYDITIIRFDESGEFIDCSIPSSSEYDGKTVGEIMITLPSLNFHDRIDYLALVNTGSGKMVQSDSPTCRDSILSYLQKFLDTNGSVLCGWAKSNVKTVMIKMEDLPLIINICPWNITEVTGEFR